jgi:hypothetical protein
VRVPKRPRTSARIRATPGYKSLLRPSFPGFLIRRVDACPGFHGWLDSVRNACSAINQVHTRHAGVQRERPRHWVSVTVRTEALTSCLAAAPGSYALPTGGEQPGSCARAAHADAEVAPSLRHPQLHRPPRYAGRRRGTARAGADDLVSPSGLASCRSRSLNASTSSSASNARLRRPTVV